MSQMPTPSVESLSVNEFLARFDDADIYRQTQVIQMFKIATEILEESYSREPSLGGPPQIRISFAQGLQAEGNSWAIYINEDLVNYYLNLSEPPVLEIIPEIKEQQRHFHDQFFFISAAFTWMVLHELSHSRRAHNDVVQAVGVSIDTWFAIEMDADLLATAAIYRLAQHRYKAYHADLIIKKLALTIIYWGFRGLPEPKSDDSHPSSMTRLAMMMKKLMMVRRVPEDPPDPDFKSEESRLARDPLLKCFINCERAFSERKGVEPDFTLLEEFCSGSTMPIVVRWDEMRSHVSRLSGTQA